jgi:hypothetical protein
MLRFGRNSLAAEISSTSSEADGHTGNINLL